jgi:hypothetical protein
LYISRCCVCVGGRLMLTVVAPNYLTTLNDSFI